jgi:hypothetical protein
LTAPSVSVGNVLYYTFGRYNSSAATLDGVPAGQTAWGTPTAASIFQDIRSDNWNGTTPPTYGVPSSYGTTGYYISRSTGNCYFNNGIFRGDITGASGSFSGSLNAATGSFAGSLSAATGSFTGNITGSANINITGTGIFGGASSSGPGTYAVVANSGYGANGGVISYSSQIFNGAFMGYASGNALAVYGRQSGSQSAVQADNTVGGNGIYNANGVMATNSSTLVTNLNAQYLNGVASSGYATVASGTDAYAANRLNGSAGVNVLRFVQGTLTGASVATFNAAAKPGSASTNVWMQITIDSTTLYIPVWT